MSEFANHEESEYGDAVTCPSLLGMTIRQLREFRKMSQADLARESGVQESVISRIEGGQTRSLHTPNLQAIATALQVKFTYLKNLAYGLPPASAEEIWNRYIPVIEAPNQPANKRQVYLELLDIVLNESDEYIKQQAVVLLKQVANWMPYGMGDAMYQNGTSEKQMPVDWEERAKHLIETRNII